jgi:hypothetical protein
MEELNGIIVNGRLYKLVEDSDSSCYSICSLQNLCKEWFGTEILYDIERNSLRHFEDAGYIESITLNKRTNEKYI